MAGFVTERSAAGSCRAFRFQYLILSPSSLLRILSCALKLACFLIPRFNSPVSYRLSPPLFFFHRSQEGDRSLLPSPSPSCVSFFSLCPIVCLPDSSFSPARSVSLAAHSQRIIIFARPFRIISSSFAAHYHFRSPVPYH